MTKPKIDAEEFQEFLEASAMTVMQLAQNVIRSVDDPTYNFIDMEIEEKLKELFLQYVDPS